MCYFSPTSNLLTFYLCIFLYICLYISLSIYVYLYILFLFLFLPQFVTACLVSLITLHHRACVYHQHPLQRLHPHPPHVLFFTISLLVVIMFLFQVPFIHSVASRVPFWVITCSAFGQSSYTILSNIPGTVVTGRTN